MNNFIKVVFFKLVLIFLIDLLVYHTSGIFRAPGESFSKSARGRLKFKPKKCDLFQTQGNYMGHVLDKTRIRQNLKKLEAVGNWERPKTVIQVRHFRRFVINIANL